MEDSRTIAGDDSSRRSGHVIDGLVGILHQPSKLLSTISWYITRINLLTGIATLGAATALLALSGGRKNDARNREMSFRLMPLILAAFSLLFFTGRSDRIEREKPVEASEKVRTG